MTDQAPGLDAAPTPQTVGERLRAAREAQGLSLAEVASRTRVPLRHLKAIEASNFAGLPSSTYAVGFVRSYARAVGGDEVMLAHDTRIEVANTVRTTPAYQPYEIADPKRVPSRATVVIATGLGIAVLVLAALFFTTQIFQGRGTGDAGSPPPVVAALPTAPVRPTAASGGQVRLTATDEVWVRIYDQAGETLKIGTMKPGEAYDVPPAAQHPMINVGRPDKLTVTLNGSAVAPLGTGERAIKDVPIGAAALAARAAGQPAPDVGPAPAASPSAAASVPPAFAAPARPTPRPTAARSRPRVVPSGDAETRRANQRSPAPSPTSTATP